VNERKKKEVKKEVKKEERNFLLIFSTLSRSSLLVILSIASLYRFSLSRYHFSYRFSLLSIFSITTQIASLVVITSRNEARTAYLTGDCIWRSSMRAKRKFTARGMRPDAYASHLTPSSPRAPNCLIEMVNDHFTLVT
jgi:hypothetical protein